MKKVPLIISLAFALSLILGLSLPKYPKPPPPSYRPQHQVPLPSILAHLTRSDALLLDQALANPPLQMDYLAPPMSSQEQVGATEAGLVVPHHLMAAGSILKAYQLMQSFKPTAVVILSPAHQSPVKHPAVSCDLPIQLLNTSYALHPAVEDLIHSGHLVAENSRFASEHGIYHQLPFVSKTYGHVRVLPLALARNMDLAGIEDLMTALELALKDEKVLYVASVDFSHYLPASVANQKDQTTQSWIANGQYDALLAASNDYLDAPSVIAFMMLKFEHMDLLWHSNSAQISGYGFNAPGTSYHIYSCYNNE